jgi:serine/threonine protein kinase
MSVYLVMEYLPGGNLLSYVHESPDPWPEQTCRFYGAEILLALEHLHAHNVVYRDLKLENLLMDMDGHVRLSDFGLSARLRSDSDRVHSLSGTAGYLAPEILRNNGEGHGKSVDVWAFGVMMFILLLHESPFYSENLGELFQMILHEPIMWHWYHNELSTEGLDLLRGLLIKDPRCRLGCGPQGLQEIREHPFFMSVQWDDLLSMKAPGPIRPLLRVRTFLLPIVPVNRLPDS